MVLIIDILKNQAVLDFIREQLFVSYSILVFSAKDIALRRQTINSVIALYITT